MQYWIGLELDGRLKQLINQFRADHQYPAAPPLIELLSPEQLGNFAGIKQRLRAFCLSQKGFKAIVGGPNVESGEYLYLTVLPGAIDSMREKLIKYFALPADQKNCRSSLVLLRPLPEQRENLQLLLADAKQTFAKPHSIEMESVSLYCRKTPQEPFELSASYPFTGR